MREINELIWHTAATPQGKHFDVHDIRRWHVEDRGWSDVGYHKVVLLDGTVQDGRPESRIGAHVAGHNTGTIGYCYIGGVDADNPKIAKDTRTPEQKETMLRLTKEAIKKYKLKKVSGHRDYAAKACPCFDARGEYGHLVPAAEPRAAGLVEWGDKGWQVEALQKRLVELGYPVVVDGHFGRETKNAVLAFQSDNEVAVDGVAGPETMKALETASPIEKGTRAVEDEKDLAARGSRTIKKAGMIQRLTAWGGGGTAVAAGANEGGLLEQGEQAVETGQRTWSLYSSAQDLLGLVAEHWYAVLALVVVVVIWQSSGIKQARVEDHRSGKTT